MSGDTGFGYRLPWKCVPFEGGLRQRKAVQRAERKPELEERDAAIA